MISPETPRKIGLIDDHKLVLDGLEKTLVGMNIARTVSTYSSPSDILDRIDQGETFDLIITDLIMDGMNGLAFLSALRSRKNRTPVLLMSGIAMDPPLEQMKSLGAKGFVHKAADPEIFETAIETILSGGTHFPADSLAGGNALETPVNRDELSAINGLTDRQLEVLKAMAKGATNQEISDKLCISPNTVKTHIKNLYDAFGVSRRTACIQKAQLYGIL